MAVARGRVAAASSTAASGAPFFCRTDAALSSRMRHPPLPAPSTTCGRDGSALQQVRLEVWHGFRCYLCHKPVPVLKMRQYDAAANARDIVELPPSVREPAAEIGVTVDYLFSNGAGKSYMMHVCPHCGVGQGDYYLHNPSYRMWTPCPGAPGPHRLLYALSHVPAMGKARDPVDRRLSVRRGRFPRRIGIVCRSHL